jgi:integrase
LIADRLGHASIRVTMDVYGSLMPGMEDKAVEALDDAMRRRGVSETTESDAV